MGKSVLIDMMGKKCGNLTVIERAPNHIKSKKAFWKCRCDCGNESVVSGYDLRREGNKGIRSCGCTRYLSWCNKIGYIGKELDGQKIGRLTVVEREYTKYYKSKSNGHHVYRCICECGKEKFIVQNNLIEGKTVSCGCLSREKASKRIKFAKLYDSLKKKTCPHCLVEYETLIKYQKFCTNFCAYTFHNKKSNLRRKLNRETAVSQKIKETQPYATPQLIENIPIEM